MGQQQQQQHRTKTGRGHENRHTDVYQYRTVREGQSPERTSGRRLLRVEKPHEGVDYYLGMADRQIVPGTFDGDEFALCAWWEQRLYPS